MRYDYWVVRYVPDPIRGEFVNIGVIAGRDQDWSMRRVSNLRRASRIGGSAVVTDPFLHRIEDAIHLRLNEVESLIPSDRGSRFGKGRLEDLRHRMNNIVQLSESRPVVASSSEEAADLAFDLMVVDIDHEVKHRSRTRVVHKLRDAFNLRPELLKHVAQHQIASVGAQETAIDFAVQNFNVKQMSQVWAFDVRDTRNLQTQIRAWNYLLGLLREDGGVLKSKGGRVGASIPANVEINAVYTPPTSEEGDTQLHIALDGWRRLGVDAIPSSESEAVVKEAERLIGSPI